MFIPNLIQTLISPWFPVLRETGLVFQWAVSTSILIALILLLRWALAGKLSMRVRYGLWAVVLVRLLVPIQMPFSLPVAPQVADHIPTVINQPSVPIYPVLPSSDAVSSTIQYPSGGNSGGGNLNDSDRPIYVQSMEDGQTVSTPMTVLTGYEVLLCVWWVGVLVTGGVIILSNLRFTAGLRKRRKPLELDSTYLPVYTIENISSPCLVGVIRPTVYLSPETAEDTQMRAHVLAHELTHHAHGDHIWAVLRGLCLALHWYNPVVWLAVSLSKKDSELACDEGAVARLGEEQRLSYGRTLVELAAGQKPRPVQLLSCSTAMAQGKKTIQQRVTSLVKHPRTVIAALVTGVVALGMALIFVFAGTSSHDKRYNEFIKTIPDTKEIMLSSSPDFEGDMIRSVLDTQEIDAILTLLASGEASKDPITYDQLMAFDQQLFLVISSGVPEYQWEDGIFSSSNAQGLLLARGEDGGILVSLGDKIQPLATLSAEAVDEIYSLTGGGYMEWTDYAYYADSGTIYSLIQLILDDEVTIALNSQGHDGDTQLLIDWLNNDTHSMTLYYGIPLGGEEHGVCWHIRAIDAGSFWAIALPEHMVEPVLKICFGSLYDPTAPIRWAQEIWFSPGNDFPQEGEIIEGALISDPDLLAQAKKILLSGDVSPDGYVQGLFSTETGSVSLYTSDRGRYRLSYYNNADMTALLLPLCQQQLALNQAVADEEAQKEQALEAELLNTMRTLQPDDIVSWDSSDVTMDTAELAQLIAQAADHVMDEGVFHTFMCHDLWSLEMNLPDKAYITISAGVTEGEVMISGGQRIFGGSYASVVCDNCPELYQMMRNRAVEPPIEETDQRVLAIMDQVLAQELANAQTDEYVGACYLDIALTDLRFVSSHDDLMKDSVVNLYEYDYGYVMDDLSNAPWAGGPWVDSELRYHPGSVCYYLITVERNGEIIAHNTLRYENPLDPEAYVAESGMPSVGDILTPYLPGFESLVVENRGTQGDIAAAFGTELAEMYLRYGSGHGNAVSFAQFVDADIYDRTDTVICATVSIALDPLDFNTIHWMSGPGLDQPTEGPWAGHFLHIREYRFDLQQDGKWHCVDSSSGGLRVD